jgi:exonuclease VII large subunit
MSEAAPRANLPEFSVSEIAAALKRTVEDSFPFVRVRGEISGLKFIPPATSISTSRTTRRF